MNNLIKKSDLTNLSPIARDVYVASNKPMIKSYEDLNIVVNSIHVSITQVIADKGVRLETEDINYLKQNICRDIIRDFNILSLEDINVCFRMGVRGKLGEYYGINVATLYQWLEKYKNEIIPEMNKEIQLLKEIELNSKTNNDIVIIEAKKIAFRDCLSRIENTKKFIEELTQKIEEHYEKK
jgi:hypothetical protein